MLFLGNSGLQKKTLLPSAFQVAPCELQVPHAQTAWEVASHSQSAGTQCHVPCERVAIQDVHQVFLLQETGGLLVALALGASRRGQQLHQQGFVDSRSTLGGSDNGEASEPVTSVFFGTNQQQFLTERLETSVSEFDDALITCTMSPGEGKAATGTLQVLTSEVVRLSLNGLNVS